MTLKINRPTQAIIRLDHLEHNFHYLGKLAGEVSTAFFYCPMVKANAYGHGDVAVATLGSHTTLRGSVAVCFKALNN
jgi:alanine racemase